MDGRERVTLTGGQFFFSGIKASIFFSGEQYELKQGLSKDFILCLFPQFKTKTHLISVNAIHTRMITNFMNL